MRRTKRTKKLYRDLFDNPSAMFGEGVEVILFPNGENEIWIKNKAGHGFRVKAGIGKAGFSVTVRDFVGSARGDYSVARVSDSKYDGTTIKDAREVSFTKYNQTDHALAFSNWYDGNGPYPEEDSL